MRRFLMVALVLAWATPAFASGAEEPVTLIAMALTFILLTARIFGHVAETLGQPSVLGELVGGVVLGVVGRSFLPSLERAAKSPELALLAGLGVLLLLFEVGLESTVAQMVKVGWPSLRVAVLGVVAPMVLGVAVATVLMPDASVYVHAFIAASLCATSVGITARVLKDLDRSQTIEARLILGAAVLDDVLGLMVLAVVGGAIAAASNGQTLGIGSIVIIAAKAILFLGGSIWIGSRLAPVLFKTAARLRSAGALLACGLAFCFAFSALAAAMGLASIVGAFAAGLLLEEAHFFEFLSRGEPNLNTQVHPIAGFLAPVFFVHMGMLTDIGQLFDKEVAILGLALTLAGIAGKAISGLAVPNSVGPVDRVAVGLGMVPRGEVGLVFANVGLGLHIGGVAVVDSRTYAAIVMMVILTTLVTPPALKWRFGQRTSGSAEVEADVRSL